MEYPFHWIRKDHQDRVPLWCKIQSISYSSSPEMRSGGGGQGSLGCVCRFHNRAIREWHGRQDGFSKSLGGGVGK